MSIENFELILFLVILFSYFAFTLYFSFTRPYIIFDKQTPLEPDILLSSITHFVAKPSRDDYCYYSDLLFYSKAYKYTRAKHEGISELYSPHYWGIFSIISSFITYVFLKSYTWHKEQWLFYVATFVITSVLIILTFCFMNRYLVCYHYLENSLDGKISVCEPLTERSKHFPYRRKCYKDSYSSKYLCAKSDTLNYSAFKSFSEYIETEYNYSAKILTGRVNAMEVEIKYLLSEPKKHIIGSIIILALFFFMF